MGDPFVTAKEKKSVHKMQMTDGRRNIIRQLLEEYETGSAQDIQDALKDLLDGIIKKMMELEVDRHLGYCKSGRSDCDDHRNGYKTKQVNSSYGGMKVEVPQDHNSTFESQVARKRQESVSDIDHKIISMYIKGVTTRQIPETLEGIYGFEISGGFILDMTGKLLPQIEDWQNHPLSDVCPVLYIDAVHCSVRDNGAIRRLTAYVVLGINSNGLEEVLTIEVSENENARYWLPVLNSLKDRRVKDILFLCADRLTGVKEAIAATSLRTEYQKCIVHQVQNTLKYVSDKDRKLLTADLETTYRVLTGKKALETLGRSTKK